MTGIPPLFILYEVENFCRNIKLEQAKDKSHEEFLLQILNLEYNTRIENRKKTKIRLAGFPYIKI